MSKEEVAKRVEQSLDLFEQGQLIDMVALGEDVRSLITQSAANKAAEEGDDELPECCGGTGLQTSYLGEGVCLTCMAEAEDRRRAQKYVDKALAADRATRPVANKAEVEVNEFAMAIYDISLMLGLPRSATPADLCLAVDRLATPPATTGASTGLLAAIKALFWEFEKGAAPFTVKAALDQLEEDEVQISIDPKNAREIFAEAGLFGDQVGASTASNEDQWISRMQYDAEVDEWAIERDNLEVEIKSLKANVGASTVLTDERIDDDDGMFSRDWKCGYSIGFEAAKGLFAAQAGQVVSVPSAVAVPEELDVALTVFDMGLGFALCHRDFGSIRAAVKKLQEDFTAIRKIIAPSPAKESK